ncbi:MAG TPA: class I SAM-dependent methyltransferase, partial [Candidatus Sulfopaludibacter sp.]|nr:class I SAM-dependent methyltransferase [Candidatus Sulfopaludibacter sp.]
LAPDDWKGWVQDEVRSHPIYPILLEDPFVRHSATRPRGYPGDAELLDYIYRSGNVRRHVDRTTPLGRRLLEYSTSTPAPAAVRHRLSLTVSEIGRMEAAGARPHVLSIACGHLSEAGLLRSLGRGRLARFVALDQDPRSLELVRREWTGHGVEAVQCSAIEFTRHGRAFGKFDFIYALGLYDYLSDKAASCLLATALDMLHAGGKVWVANFVEGIPAAGYMEAVMDWWLTYRSAEQLEALAQSLPQGKAASRRTFFEPAGNLAFLEVVRA